jgi:arginine-tRNA-protein transferase
VDTAIASLGVSLSHPAGVFLIPLFLHMIIFFFRVCRSSSTDACLDSPTVGYSYYLSCRSVSASFYQDLLDRGFRRSGNLLYKPDLRKSCCPHYTIRLDSLSFKASKDQRQALNRLNTYVVGDEYLKEAARRFPRSKEEAAKRKTAFDLVERVHESESGVLHATQCKSLPELFLAIPVTIFLMN